MRSSLLLAIVLTGSACGSRPPADPANGAGGPDSTWVRVTRPTIIAFHPRVSNEQIDADEGLATVLDDLAYHLGSAIPSLDSIGVDVQYQAGDTIKSLAPEAQLWVRPRDSADVGYLFVDPRGHRAEVYGVRSNLDLVKYAREFVRTGRPIPR